MLKIAILGYGKMGRAIEEIALQKGHSVVLKIDKDNLSDLNPQNIKRADVAIEFSNPESAVRNILFCLEQGVPVVCGTTGWLEHINQVKKACEEADGAFLYASNFSIGVNLFFELNKVLAGLMQSYKEYDIQMEEVHHARKVDAPSGTAITLAEQILNVSGSKSKWVNEASSNEKELSIISKRIDEVPGTHTVMYKSAIDDIEIKHTAHTRIGFATGAVAAAEYLAGKKGIFSMSDVLGFK